MGGEGQARAALSKRQSKSLPSQSSWPSKGLAAGQTSQGYACQGEGVHRSRIGGNFDPVLGNSGGLPRGSDFSWKPEEWVRRGEGCGTKQCCSPSSSCAPLHYPASLAIRLGLCNQFRSIEKVTCDTSSLTWEQGVSFNFFSFVLVTLEATSDGEKAPNPLCTLQEWDIHFNVGSVWNLGVSLLSPHNLTDPD